MKTIAFHSNQLSIRGTEVALYDYALNSETLLNHRSLIVYNASSPHNSAEALTKFNSRFDVVSYRHPSELDALLSHHQADLMYAIKAGKDDGLWSRTVPTMVHAVFPTSPGQVHGASYAFISEWLSRHCANDRIPSVPHIVELPDVDENLREELRIPQHAKVLGCHGGQDSFDVPCSIQAVQEILANGPDTWFIFLNIGRFIDHPRALFLPGSSDMAYKTRFINTCDAMLHARLQGESFGIACGEFSIRNKPVITYARSKHRHHIDVLGESGFYYTDTRSLVAIIERFDPAALRHQAWDRYSAVYNRQVVMDLFDQHLIQPALRNRDPSRPELNVRWQDKLAFHRFKLRMRFR